MQAEKHGIPSVVIVTEPFAYKARREAEALGVGAVPIAVLPHPLGQAPVEVVHRATDQVIDEVLAAVTEAAGRVDTFYRRRVAKPGAPGLRPSAPEQPIRLA